MKDEIKQQIEKAASEWYQSIIERTGLDLTPNKRSLNGFNKGAEYGYSLAQHQSEKAVLELKKELLNFITKATWEEDSNSEIINDIIERLNS